MTLAIAIVALLVACGAVLAAGRALRQVAMLAEALADAAEDEPEPDSPELWVSDGDLHTSDAAALYEATGAIALCVTDGVPCAVVKGVGVVSLHKLFSDKPTVRAIK